MTLKEQLTRMVEKSLRSINAAKRNVDEGDYDFACSRTYYAIFYLLEAALLTKNLVYSKHGGVIGAFNKNFIKNGLFPREFSKIVSQLFRERQVGDYEFEMKIAKSEAEKNIENAVIVVNAIIHYLVNEKLIDPVECK